MEKSGICTQCYRATDHELHPHFYPFSFSVEKESRLQWLAGLKNLKIGCFLLNGLLENVFPAHGVEAIDLVRNNTDILPPSSLSTHDKTSG